MRHYIAIASLAMFFSAGSHAEDWSLSTWQHGPRSQVVYEASSISKAQPKWRATAHRHRQPNRLQEVYSLRREIMTTPCARPESTSVTR